MSSHRYRVILTSRAEKDILRLRPWADQATSALLALEENPVRGHGLAGSLRGARSLEFSLPGGAYRAAYIVLKDECVCLVFLVGSHEGFYKKAERRFAAVQK